MDWEAVRNYAQNYMPEIALLVGVIGAAATLLQTFISSRRPKLLRAATRIQLAPEVERHNLEIRFAEKIIVDPWLIDIDLNNVGRADIEVAQYQLGDLSVRFDFDASAKPVAVLEVVGKGEWGQKPPRLEFSKDGSCLLFPPQLIKEREGVSVRVLVEGYPAGEWVQRLHNVGQVMHGEPSEFPRVRAFLFVACVTFPIGLMSTSLPEWLEFPVLMIWVLFCVLAAKKVDEYMLRFRGWRRDRYAAIAGRPRRLEPAISRNRTTRASSPRPSVRSEQDAGDGS